MSPGDSTIQLVDASVEPGLGLAKDMFRSYAAEWSATIAETLCFQGFDAEVAGLPGRYAPPSGCLLLAMEGDIPAGCVALRDLGDGTCEMKRLYVTPVYRGRGVGRSLVEEVIRRSEGMGYRRMVLDTMPEMAGAIALYRECGFVGTGSLLGPPGKSGHLHGEAARRLRPVLRIARRGGRPIDEGMTLIGPSEQPGTVGHAYRRNHYAGMKQSQIGIREHLPVTNSMVLDAPRSRYGSETWPISSGSHPISRSSNRPTTVMA